jgi:hypothetical protein
MYPGLEDFDINLLKRPDKIIEEQESEDMDIDDSDLNPTHTPAARSQPKTDDPMADDNSDQPVDLDIAPKPWLDSQCPGPPMPMSGTPYTHMLLTRRVWIRILKPMIQ